MAIEPIVNPYAPGPERYVQRRLAENLLQLRLLVNDGRAASGSLLADPKALDRRPTRVDSAAKPESAEARAAKLRRKGRDGPKNSTGSGGRLDVLV